MESAAACLQPYRSQAGMGSVPRVVVALALSTSSTWWKSRTERSPVEGGGREKRGQEGPREGDARAAPGQSRGRAAPLGTRQPKRPSQAAGRRGVGVQVTSVVAE